MKIEALDVFCKVLQLRSFSRGAAEAKISQSAASQLVASLEEQLGFKLIDRTRRPWVPTPEGQIYFEACRDILRRHRQALTAIGQRRQGLPHSIRVASIYSAGLHTLSRYISDFMGRHDTTVRLEYLHPTKVYDVVLRGEADLGVTSYPKAHRDLKVKPWLEEAMVLACPVGHRLATLEHVALKDLRHQNFVAFDSELKIRRAVDRQLKAEHVPVEIVSEFDNIETIKQALEISNAVSILPRSTIEREVQRGTLVERPIDGFSLTRPIGIIYQRRSPLDSATQLFVDSLLRDASPSPQGELSEKS